MPAPAVANPAWSLRSTVEQARDVPGLFRYTRELFR